MANIYGINANGKTAVVGEMDDSLLVGIGGEASGCGKSKKGEMSGCGSKKKKKSAGESFEAKKAKLTGGKKRKKNVKEDTKPGKGTPEGDEDAITDPDNETPVGIGNTAKDKKKKGTASEACGSKKKGC